MKRDYYIFTPGRVHRKDNTLRFSPFDENAYLDEDLLLGIDDFFPETNEKQKKVLPVNDINSIYIMTDATLSTKMLEFANQNHFPLHFFNNFGYYTGSFYPKKHLLSGFLLVKQVKHYSTKAKRMKLAQQFVLGASKNILKNMKYYNNRREGLNEKTEEIELLIPEIDTQNEIHDLMNIEGRIRKIYYSSFNDILSSDVQFTTRDYNPPSNPMNAMISFANSLVYTAVLSEIYQTQLDPTISFLHGPGTRRFSLALDIAEIFKPLFSDRIIFKLLNKKSITKKDFEKELNGFYLKESGRKKFIAEFDEKLKTTIKHRDLGRTISYKRLIRLECYKLVKHLTGDKDYEPFIIWW